MARLSETLGLAEEEETSYVTLLQRRRRWRKRLLACDNVEMLTSSHMTIFGNVKHIS